MIYFTSQVSSFSSGQSFSSSSFTMVALLSSFEKGRSVVCNVLVISNQQYSIWTLELTAYFVTGIAALRESIQC